MVQCCPCTRPRQGSYIYLRHASPAHRLTGGQSRDLLSFMVSFTVPVHTAVARKRLSQQITSPNMRPTHSILLRMPGPQAGHISISWDWGLSSEWGLCVYTGYHVDTLCDCLAHCHLPPHPREASVSADPSLASTPKIWYYSFPCYPQTPLQGWETRQS